MAVAYADGCRLELEAPTFVRVDPGHDGWVVGDEPAVLVQVDFGPETAARMGVADSHRHSGDS